MATIMGEANPGFELWTSAHGFHHLKLTQSRGWKCFWVVVLFIHIVALISCVIYYFYYVFASAYYSKFILESAASVPWPVTIVCDRQFFSNTKVTQVPPLSNSHAALLSWSVNPSFARPDVMNNTRIYQLTADINTALSKSDFNKISYGTSGAIPGGPMEQLLRAVAPNCSQLILSCTVGRNIMTGFECCAKVFDPSPYFTTSGTCYSTRGGQMRQIVTEAGDGSALTITTMHYDQGGTGPFDQQFVKPSLYGVNGLSFAVVDDQITPQAAMATRGVSVLPGTYASVAISRMKVDNNDLGWSAIARVKCQMAGERSPTWIDVEFNYGVDYRYGYTRDTCTQITKMEMRARELIYCTFSPLVGDNMQRCNANQSVAYFRSFIDANATVTPDIPIFYVDNKPGLSTRLAKVCPADCVQDRYVLTPSYTTMTDLQRTSLTTSATASGQPITGAQPSFVILKLFLSSMEYQHIYNYPQPGLQFIAELGGLMVFFLGISFVSVIECCCYCCCCGCNKESDDD